MDACSALVYPGSSGMDYHMAAERFGMADDKGSGSYEESLERASVESVNDWDDPATEMCAYCNDGPWTPTELAEHEHLWHPELIDVE